MNWLYALKGSHRILKDHKGSVLVVVLAGLALITALLTEYVYSFYVSTVNFHHWFVSQQLSGIARSGVVLSSKVVSEAEDPYVFLKDGSATLPIEKVSDSFQGRLTIRAVDENGRFNLNSLVFQNGEINPDAHRAFQRLLRVLGIDDKKADLIVDWIDRDRTERIRDGEVQSKNSPFNALDELYQIRGLTKEEIEKLWNYVTVYGYDRVDSPVVNINSASVPVIMSIDDRITPDLAERIVQFRRLEAFKSPADILKVSGFEGPLGQSMLGKIAVRLTKLRISSEAELNSIKRTIDCVVELRGSSQTVLYWSER